MYIYIFYILSEFTLLHAWTGTGAVCVFFFRSLFLPPSSFFLSYVHYLFICIVHCLFICIERGGEGVGDMTRSRATRLIHTWHDSARVTWLLHAWPGSFIRDMTHSHVTWLMHTYYDSFTCNVTHFRYMIFAYVTWLLHTWHAARICNVTHSHMGWLRLVGSLNL